MNVLQQPKRTSGEWDKEEEEEKEEVEEDERDKNYRKQNFLKISIQYLIIHLFQVSQIQVWW